MNRACQLTLGISLAILWLASDVATQQAAEMQSARVMPMRSSNGTAGPPVLTAVSLSPDGRTFATGGDDHVGADLESRRRNARARAALAFRLGARRLSYNPQGADHRLGRRRSSRSVLGRRDRAAETHASRPVASHLFPGFQPGWQSAGRRGLRRQGTPLRRPDRCRDSRAGRPVRRYSRHGFLARWKNVRRRRPRWPRPHLGIPDRRRRARHQGPPATRARLGFSLDGGQLASGGDDRFLRIWNPETGDELLSIPSRPGKIHALDISRPTNSSPGPATIRFVFGT